MKNKYIKVKDGLFKWEDKLLTLANYKEPLRKIDEGFGWYGTLASTTDGNYIQCHICGEFCIRLDMHARNKHKITSRDYKEKFGLQYTSALIAENTRKALKQSTIEYIMKLTPEERKKYVKDRATRLKNARKNRTRFQPRKTLEQMNKSGMCPDQTLEEIKKVKEQLGHVPSKDEFIEAQGTQRFVHLAYKFFGSWNNAIKMCHFNKEDDTRMVGMGRYKGVGKYSDEDLLEYLRIYAEENRQIPTATDFRRGVLPDYKRYLERFGNIENARQLAGVYNFVDGINEFDFKKSKFYRNKSK